MLCFVQLIAHHPRSARVTPLTWLSTGQRNVGASSLWEPSPIATGAFQLASVVAKPLLDPHLKEPFLFLTQLHIWT